jgi:hypothetical protein
MREAALYLLRKEELPEQAPLQLGPNAFAWNQQAGNAFMPIMYYTIW